VLTKIPFSDGTHPISRWVLCLSKNSIEIIYQFKFEDADKWSNSHTAIYAVEWNFKVWNAFEIYHVWFDGTHCGLNCGPFTIQWWNPRCSKCWNGGE
jgi:hypothetical protein